MPAKGAGMGRAGGATAMGGGGGHAGTSYVAAPITGNSVGKSLAYSKYNGHASEGRHARGSPRILRVQN